MRLTSLPLLVALLLVVACAGPRPALQGMRQWNFDEVAVGAVPADFTVDATRRVGPLASWEVTESKGAPSPKHALSLSYPNHKSYDSFNLCWNKSVGFLDGAVTVNLCARSGTEDQGGGLIWRARGPDDYYVVRLNPLESNLRLYHVVAGNRTMLASAECASVVGQWHELRVEHRQDLIQCAVDGKVLIAVADAALPDAGGIGLWTKADAATDFDDLRVDGTVR